jgi:hypothetical protein
MKLDAWLRQSHPPADRFRLVERLSQALNEVHDRGETLGALEPARVEVAADLHCNLSAAATARSPEAGYAAPERREGGPASPEADIYSAGAIAWEVLAGRTCGEQPAPLAEVAPELPRELASAVMGCLERSPQWRPKDLTYLAQLAVAQQKAGRPETAPTSVHAPARRRSASPVRPPATRKSRSTWTLVVATVLVLVAAALNYRMIRGQSPIVPPGDAAGSRVKGAPGPLDEPTPAEPERSPATGTSSLAAEPTPAPAPTPTPTPTPTPAPAAATAVPPAARAADTPPISPVDTLPVPPAAGPVAPAVQRPSAPVVLTALSPPAVRRPGKVLLDLRGTGLRSDLLVRVVALREMPRGITVARQKWVSGNLMTVLLELDADVKPAVYAIALEDPTGGPLKSLELTVTK